VRRLQSIQHLRAVAAIGVVLYHACQWGHARFEIGASGVDLFFVISGFVIGLGLDDAAATPAGFMARRVWRVAPPYWLVTLALLLIALVWPRWLPEVEVEPAHVILSLLFIPHVNPDQIPFPILPVGWSLTYEMIFYVLAAACLTQPPRRRLGLLAAGLVAMPIFGVNVHPAFFLFANPMMLQFLAGALVARAYRRGALPRYGGGWAMVGAAGLAYVALYWFDLYGSLFRPLAWGAPATLLVAGAVSLEREGHWPRFPALDRLGEASYSIYLMHWPVVVMLAQTLGVRPAWVFIPLSSLCAVGAGLVFWRWVERPLPRLRRRSVSMPPAGEAAAGA
jgi:exopolysaccharide production protein ExoZ